MQERREDAVAVCYLGEGAASEGDASVGLNMASTLGGPLVFFVRNNEWAISTPASQQFRGELVTRGAAYGLESARVDGNDALATFLVCKEARRRAVKTRRPVLIEAMTYRAGHHSTCGPPFEPGALHCTELTRMRRSDDSSAYRKASAKASPQTRLRRYLEHRGLWSAEQDEALRAQVRKDVLGALMAAERAPKPELMHGLFGDVYAELPPHLVRQRAELERLIAKWGHVEPWKSQLATYSNVR